MIQWLGGSDFVLLIRAAIAVQYIITKNKAGAFSNRGTLRPTIHLWIMRSVFLQA